MERILARPLQANLRVMVEQVLRRYVRKAGTGHAGMERILARSLKHNARLWVPKRPPYVRAESRVNAVTIVNAL